MSISTQLGTRKLALTSQGPISYRERGEGEPILFLHEWSSNADTFRRLIPFLGDQYRLIFPDWPYAIHEVPMNRGADLSTPGLVRIMDEFIGELGLDAVTVVGSGGGCAMGTVLATRHPDRVARLMVTTGDALQYFPAPNHPVAKIVKRRTLTWFFTHVRRLPGVGPWYYAKIAKKPLDEDVVKSYCDIPAKHPEARQDLRRAVLSIRAEYSLAAAEQLHRFAGPIYVVWAPEDKVFPVDYAYRLAELSDARLELVEDCFSFMASDQPERFAELIHELMKEAPATAGETSTGARTTSAA